MSAVARLTDPITSHEAAASVPVPHHEAYAMHVLRCAPGPVTDEELFELAQAYGYRGSAASLRSRRHELTERGLVRLAGYTRPQVGRRRCLWTAAPWQPALDEAS